MLIFERKESKMNQQLSQSVRALMAINIVIFIVQNVQPELGVLLIGHYFQSSSFQPWQIITQMFTNTGVLNLLFSMFILWMFGNTVSKRIGDNEFMFFYIICGVVSFVFFNLFATLLNSNSVFYGVQGAIYGTIVAFGILYPNQKMMLLIPPVPLKVKYFVIGILVLGLYPILFGNPVAFGYLGGALAGGLLMLAMKKKWNL